MKKHSKSQSKRKNEFRYHNIVIRSKKGRKKSIRHPAYIWKQRGNIYDYHSITHSSAVDGINLQKLTRNPNPVDKRDAYFDIDSKSDIKSSFGRKKRRWKLSDEDRIEIHQRHKKR